MGYRDRSRSLGGQCAFWMMGLGLSVVACGQSTASTPVERAQTGDASTPTVIPQMPAPASEDAGATDATTQDERDATTGRLVEAGMDLPDDEPALPWSCPDDAWGRQRVDVGTLTLHVACSGSGPLLLLLHGYPEYHMAFDDLRAPLVARGYALVAPDHRGYHLSDRPGGAGDYAVQHVVDDLRGLVSASGRTRLAVVGHDWGGLLSYLLARALPDEVRALVVMNGPHPDIWGQPDVDPVQAEATAAYVPLLAGPLAPLALPIIDAELTPLLSAQGVRDYRALWNEPGALSHMNAWYGDNIHPESRLPTGVHVDVPTLAIWGMRDQYVTPSQLDHLGDYVSNLQVLKLPDANHWVTHQQTATLVDAIDDFVSAH